MILAPIVVASDAEPPEADDDAALSRAQSRVLKFALTGLTEKQIALRLHRSPHTVHSHLRAIYRHFCVSSRAELLARAIDGDLSPGRGL